MSSVIVLGIILLVAMLVSFLIAITIGHILIGTVFALLMVGSVGLVSFNFLRKIGAFGYEKMLVKYFFRIDKIVGGRATLHKIKLWVLLFFNSQTNSFSRFKPLYL